MPILHKVLDEYHPRLVIIDPIQAYLSGIDMNRANETRPLLAALQQLAEQYACAIACIRHPAKASQGGKALHRGLGSVDFIGAARTGLFVEQHPLDETKVLVAQSKSNVGPLGRTLIFSKEGGQFEWCGRSRLSAEMLAGSGRGPDPHAFLEAVIWLEQRLEDGLPVASALLREEAEEEGLSFPTLRRAKKALRIQSHKRGEEWDWQLPGLRVIPQPTPLVALASLEPLEHVQLYQNVSGKTEVALEEPGAPEDGAGPIPCGCGHAHAPGDCPPQPVENEEEAQETQEAHEAEEAPPAPAPSAPAGGRKCWHCKKPTTWILRGGIPFCSKCRTPDLRAR